MRQIFAGLGLATSGYFFLYFRARRKSAREELARIKREKAKEFQKRFDFSPYDADPENVRGKISALYLTCLRAHLGRDTSVCVVALERNLFEMLALARFFEDDFRRVRLENRAM